MAKRRRIKRFLARLTFIAFVFAVCLLVLHFRENSLSEQKTKQMTVVEKEQLVKKSKPKRKEEPKPVPIVGALPESAKENGYDVVEVGRRLREHDYSPLGQDFERDTQGTKAVFLTFDDGPSLTNTPKVLDILKEHNVKATFCVLGSSLGSEKAQEILKRELAEGHAIGNHTYSHEYSNLYPGRRLNLENFKKELSQTDEVLKEILGENFSTRMVRCPGGLMSWKGMDELVEHLAKNNKGTVDWNALIGDAEGKKKNAEQLLEYMKKEIDDGSGQIRENLGMIVLLMHDTYGKEETVSALPSVIEFFKRNGYEFKILV